MPEPPWFKRYAEAIVTGLITTAFWVSAAALYEKYPTLLAPAAYCFACGATAFVICAAVIALRRIPKPSPCPNTDNIEGYVRDWLDSQRFTVTNDPNAGVFFRYRVTLPPPDSEHISIFRMREENPDYLHVYADMAITPENWAGLEKQFSEDEINHIMYEMKLELARAKVGYSGLSIPPTQFRLFRRVAIHSGLREPEFLAAINDVEAAMHIVAVIYLRAIQEKNKEIRADGVKQPESVSDIPVRELPSTSS